jgi:hypothetical protein
VKPETRAVTVREPELVLTVLGEPGVTVLSPNSSSEGGDDETHYSLGEDDYIDGMEI